MFRFGVKNLRRLNDVNLFDIRPITLLVGRNSSGKSTFLRTFPLLRQSLQTRTSSPILWYGDFVDFGSFENVVSNNDISKSIQLSFGLDSVRLSRSSGYPYYFHHTMSSVSGIEVSVALSAVGEKTFLSYFTIRVASIGASYRVEANPSGNIVSITLNEEEVIGSFSEHSLFMQSGSIFPNVQAIPKKEIDAVAPSIFNQQSDPALKVTANVLKPKLDKRTSDEQVRRLAAEFLAIDEFSNVELTRLSERSGQTTFRKLIADVASKNGKKLREPLQRAFQTSLFVPLCNSVFSSLRSIMSQTLYIGPVRARSERYYRYQELAVSEIDPDGKNFPMFLNSLSERQLNAFSKWVKDRFGYGIHLSKPQGHISIELVVDNNTTNIVDNGYGISQVLPVLGQIWWAANRPRLRETEAGTKAPTLIVVEQPELHLHPAHQALLADALAADSHVPSHGSNRSRLQFVIETHSEVLVNRLGELIAEGKIRSEDVQILIFDASGSDNRTTDVSVADFDADGVLINWPYGFFQPDPL